MLMRITQHILMATVALISLSGISSAVQYVNAPPLTDAVKARMDDAMRHAGLIN